MEVTDNFTPSLPLPVPVSQDRNEIKSNVSINATTIILKSTNNTSSNSNAKVMQLPARPFWNSIRYKLLWYRRQNIICYPQMAS